MSVLPPDVEADDLIAAEKKANLRAYWLEAMLLVGAIALGLAVWRAVTSPCIAAVVLHDIRKGDPIAADDIRFAPLSPSPRAITRDQKLDHLIAARDLEPGTPLRWNDVVKPRPRAAAGELELPLKVALGHTPPKANTSLFLGIVASEGGDAIIVKARVLAVDASSDPATLTVAMRDGDAARFAAIPKPQIQLMQRAPEEQKR